MIGCGGRGSAHIDAYKHIDGAEVIACYAPSGKNRDPLAAKYGITPYDDVEKMIRAEKPDMVHIITPPSVRVDVMTLVSDLKVPLCTTEKPVAIGVKDWKALARLERESDTKFGVCHQFLWQPDLVRCQKAAKNIGKIRFLDMSAGMNIGNQGTHTLDYGRSLIGDPLVTSVYGSAGKLDEEDRAHMSPFMSEAVLTFDNGVRSVWTSGPVSPRVGDPATTWQHVRVTAYGTDGWVNYEEFGKWDMVTTTSEEHGDWGGSSEWRRKNDLAQAGFYQAMFDWGVRTAGNDGEPPGTNLAISLHEWKVVLALYQSTLTGESVELAGFEPEDDLVEKVLNR